MQRRARYKNAPEGSKECRFCHVIKPYDQFPMMCVTGIKRNTLSSACFGCNDAKKAAKRERYKNGPVRSPDFKTCNMCRQEKPIGHFRKQSNSPDWRTTVCIECISTRNINDPDRLDYRRRYHIMHKYGLEPEDVQRMLESQGGKCQICDGLLDFTKNVNQRRRAHIDHCHGSGKIRGILCGVCNAKLGTVESGEFLVRALEYLKRYGSDPLATQEV